MSGDFTYFLCHGTRPSYKHINILGVRVYIINGCAKRKNLDDIVNGGYIMGYEATTGVILYGKPYQTFSIHEPIMFGLMNIILVSPHKTQTLQLL